MIVLCGPKQGFKDLAAYDLIGLKCLNVRDDLNGKKLNIFDKLLRVFPDLWNEGRSSSQIECILNAKFLVASEVARNGSADGNRENGLNEANLLFAE